MHGVYVCLKLFEVPKSSLIFCYSQLMKLAEFAVNNTTAIHLEVHLQT